MFLPLPHSGGCVSAWGRPDVGEGERVMGTERVTGHERFQRRAYDFITAELGHWV